MNFLIDLSWFVNNKFNIKTDYAEYNDLLLKVSPIQ